MASVNVAMALPMSSASNNRLNKPFSKSYFNPLPLQQQKRIPQSKSKLEIHATLKEKAVAGLTAASLTAAMVIPEMAHAAGSDASPSLKNFLLSIFAGGVVLTAIIGAVVGVSNFDPVKRT